MNGPADNYISACTSCHSTATRDPMKETISIVPPTDKDIMIYFRNICGGTPFDENLNPRASQRVQITLFSFKWDTVCTKNGSMTLSRPPRVCCARPDTSGLARLTQPMPLREIRSDKDLNLSLRRTRGNSETLFIIFCLPTNTYIHFHM